MAKRTLKASVRYAWRGLVYALKTQRNMRIHLGIGVAVLATSGWLRVSLCEWIIVFLTVALVLSTELLNTGLEILVDLFSPERRAEARIIKDVAAGAVLLCSVCATIVGFLVFLPRVARWLGVVSR